jgi:hypothetical protein
MNRLLTTAILVACVLLSVTRVSASSIEGIANLPPGEKYRQLSLIRLISGGADPALLDALVPENTNDQQTTTFSPDDYKTPLIRIVDQESMLSGAAFLLRFAKESRDEIDASLVKIRSDNPVLISMVDINAITEDAIIIRNAIADSIGYSSLADDQAIAAYLQEYTSQTIRIRNVMEYELFDKELARLTDEAILSVGGKLDAYQRMFDEEVDSKEFDRQFDAAEYIYNRTDKFDEKAGILTEEIMKSVVLSQSKPKP